MEPFDYPDNDPGPQTLLTTLPPAQNIDRLHWFMSRFQGYVGIANYMGARFTANEPGAAPDAARDRQARLDLFRRRRLAAQPRAARSPAPTTVPFAKADIVLDAVPTAAEHRRARWPGSRRSRASAASRSASPARCRSRSSGSRNGRRPLESTRHPAGADQRRRRRSRSRADSLGRSDSRTLMPRFDDLPYRPCVGVDACSTATGCVFVGRRNERPRTCRRRPMSGRCRRAASTRARTPMPAALRELYEETNIRSVEHARPSRRLADLRPAARYRRAGLEGPLSRPDAEMVRAALHRRRERDRHPAAGEGRAQAGIHRLALGADGESPRPGHAVQAAGLRAGGGGVCGLRA